MKVLIAGDHAVVRKEHIQLLREEFPTVKIIELSTTRTRSKKPGSAT